MTVDEAVRQAILAARPDLAGRVRIVGDGPVMSDPHVTHRSVASAAFADLYGGETSSVRVWPFYEVNVWDPDAVRGARLAQELDRAVPTAMPPGWVALPRGYRHAGLEDGWHRWMIEFQIIGGE